MVTLEGQTAGRLRALARNYLDPELQAEVERLYALEETHRLAVAEIRDLNAQVNRCQALAGHLREQLTNTERRLEDLRPDEIVKARREAYFTGAGFFKVTSLGRHRYATEHIPAERVSIRAE
ncbi:hypothetical protein GCM10028801_41470 [Nocardioides maradonensis]